MACLWASSQGTFWLGRQGKGGKHVGNFARLHPLLQSHRCIILRVLVYMYCVMYFVIAIKFLGGGGVTFFWDPRFLPPPPSPLALAISYGVRATREGRGGAREGRSRGGARKGGERRGQGGERRGQEGRGEEGPGREGRGGAREGGERRGQGGERRGQEGRGEEGPGREGPGREGEAGGGGRDGWPRRGEVLLPCLTPFTSTDLSPCRFPWWYLHYSLTGQDGTDAQERNSCSRPHWSRVSEEGAAR